MNGKTILHYEILEKLGEGGMGVVYKARDTKLDRTVALKFISPDFTPSEEDKKRFLQEARAAAKLNHPNICSIHSIYEYDNQQFIEMEYIEGETLREKMRASGRFRLAKFRDYAVQIAEGLSAAHGKGIIHRDIKPENIMVDDDGRVKIMDFGLAKLKGIQNNTKTGSTLGTLTYMSPEQIRSDEIDVRSDLFSFGIVLYEMLTGSHPFRAEYEQALMFKILNEDPEPPSFLQEGISPELEDIVIRCLEKDPERRYATARDLRIELEGETQWSIKESIGTASNGDGLIPAFQRYLRKSWSRKVMAGVFSLVLGGLLLALFFTTGNSRESIPVDKHLVVLPFNNLSTEAIPATLNDGIMEVLTSKITQMEMHQGSLWVVPSSEVRGQQVTSVNEASRLFGINLAVTGSLQGNEDRLRLTINLVDGTTLRQLDSKILEMEWTNFANLQDELVEALASMMEIELGAEAVQNFMAGSSEDPRAYKRYVEGRGSLSRFEDPERIDAAIRSFEEAIEIDSGYVRAYAGLAEAYWRKFELTRDTKWTELARDYAERGVEMNEQIVEVYVTLALINNGMGRFEESLEFLDRLEEKDRLTYEALIERAEAYEGLGQADKAEDTFLRAIERKKNYWAGYNNLGVFYYRQGRMEEAVEAFEKVAELTPDNTRIFNNLGGVYLNLGRINEGLDAFYRSLEIRPTYVAFANLGTYYYHFEKDYPEAIRMYEQALDLNDTDYQIWGNLGHAYYWSSEDSARVREVMEKAIELAGQEREVRENDPDLLGQLAGYHVALGNVEQARNLIRQLTSLNPDVLSPENRAVIAHLYERLGDRESALYWIEESLKQGYPLNNLQELEGMEDLMEDPRMVELKKKYASVD